jgi:hypothetical protein
MGGDGSCDCNTDRMYIVGQLVRLVGVRVLYREVEWLSAVGMLVVYMDGMVVR